MEVQAEDITVPWGSNPDPLDMQMARWRIAVYQDLQASVDGSKLYFLYDPEADETSGTSGGRKSGPAILVFDVNVRCFVREIPLNLRPTIEGVPKYFFALKSSSSAGGTSLVMCTEMHAYASSTIPIGNDWILCLREDAPELALLSSPGLTVTRINASTMQPSAPFESFSVPDGDMSRYYDGFIWQGSFYLLASTPDGIFDFSHVHLLDITGRNRMIPTGVRPDPIRGFPPARKQAAIDCINGRVFVWGDFDQPLPGVVAAGSHLRILRMTGMDSVAPPNYGLVGGQQQQSAGRPDASPPPYPSENAASYSDGLGFMPTQFPQQQHGQEQNMYPQQQQPSAPYPQQQQQQPYPQQQPPAPYPQQQQQPYHQQLPPAPYPQQQSPFPYPQAASYSQPQQPIYPPTQQQSFYPDHQSASYSGQNPSYPQQQQPGVPSGQYAYYPKEKPKKDCCIS